MTKPTYKVEAAFGVAALTDPGAWTDITAYVRGYSTRRGRNHELGRTQAGVAQIVLDNTDRRFDPNNASGPYYPNVRPMTHIRIRTTAPVAIPLFRGFVQDWGQGWAGPMPTGKGDAFITLGASDAFLVLSLAQIRSYSSAVGTDSPVVYWPLTEPFGQTYAVSRGAQATILRINRAFGDFGNASSPFSTTTPQSSLGIIGGTQSDFAADYQAEIGAAAEFTIECWQRYATGGNEGGIAVSYLTGGPVEHLLWQLNLGASGCQFSENFLNTLGEQLYTGTLAALGGTNTWRHVALTRSAGGVVKFYVNGVLSTTLTTVPTAIVDNGTAVLRLNDLALDGKLAHVAFYDHVLSSDRISAHYSAQIDTLANVPTGTAINYILTAAGWPSALQTVDAGLSTVTVTPDGSALDLLQQIAEDTEHGVLVMTGDGKVTFLARDTIEKRLSASATFGDGGGAEVPYHALEVAYDDQDLWTQTSVTGPPGNAIITDATAVSTYGTRTLELTTLAATSNELADQANGLLNRYKAPAFRPRRLELRGDRSTTQQLTSLIGDRVSILRRPPGGGTLTVAALIEGTDWNLGPDGWADVTYQLGAPEPASFWILADSTYGVLDTTTRMGW